MYRRAPSCVVTREVAQGMSAAVRLSLGGVFDCSESSTGNALSQQPLNHRELANARIKTEHSACI